jgi:hypothetical protein
MAKHGKCKKEKVVSNQVFLSEISSSHGSEYEVQNCLLGCTAM